MQGSIPPLVGLESSTIPLFFVLPMQPFSHSLISCFLSFTSLVQAISWPFLIQNGSFFHLLHVSNSSLDASLPMF